ncbi:MAG: hypothetical protein E6H07_14560 [Bacteroidetes bacterium]|nr:MAG: hypothetical protein E6H07_14560 [Bacteroidota bacterium]
MNSKILAFATFLFLGSTAFSQSVKLSLGAGAKYEVITTMKMSSSANAMGQTIETGMDNENTELFDVKSVTTNNNELSAVLKRIKFNLSGMGQDMSYDSDNKESKGELAEAFGKKVGKPYQVLYDDNGKVLNKDVVAEAKPEMPIPGAPAPSGKVELIDEIFIGKQLTNGYSWYDSTTTDVDKMKTTIKGTYKVLSVLNNNATIMFEGIQQQTGVMEQMGMELNMSGTSNVTKEFLLDLKTGLIIQSNTKTKGTSNIEVMGTNIPVETDVTTTKKIKLVQN